jgi:type II secretory pathway pseudopilin PulG
MKRGSQGFTLLALLIAVALMGAGLAAFGELASHARQREKEQELLFIGGQYRDAIGAFYERTPGVAKRYPRELEELLADKRFAHKPSYLRRLYPDPMNGSKTWGLVKAPDGGIMGVYSLSEEKPIKSGAFGPKDLALAGALRYCDWQFFYKPTSPTGLRAGR